MCRYIMTCFLVSKDYDIINKMVRRYVYTPFNVNFKGSACEYHTGGKGIARI